MTAEKRLFIIRLLYGYRILKVEEIAKYFHLGVGCTYELMKGARINPRIADTLQTISDFDYNRIMLWITTYALDEHFDEIRTLFNLG